MPRRLESGPVASIPTVPRTESGFRALIRHAEIWNLVQLKCESRERGVVRVVSGALTGYLYFADGQIVHASLGVQRGEAAAQEILSWRSGSWDACERPWPERGSITTPWQGLLLRVAQRQDEAARTTRSVAPPQPIAKPEESGVSPHPETFEAAVRMDAQGNVLTGHGEPEEQAALAAYAMRMGDLVGELLGTGPLRALEATLKSSARCLVFRDENGDTIALRPRAGADLAAFKEKLRL